MIRLLQSPNNVSRSIILLLPLLFLVLNACDQKRRAIGEEDEIYVFADSTEYFEIEAELLQIFGKTIFTPQPENLFKLTHKNIQELPKYKNRKNIIIVAPLNSGSDVSTYISSIIDSTVQSLFESGEEFVIKKRDLWAAGQMVMILSAPTMEQLKNDVLLNNEDLLYVFRKISNERLYGNLYSKKYERREIQGKILNEYGWVIYVQIDFHLALDKPEDNFVWLRRAPGSDMERWIFVHWIENASPELLNEDSVLAIRDRITKKRLLTSDEKSYVMIAEHYRKTSEVNFRGRYALMTQGLWHMNDKSMGGPFVNYSFYDEKSGRFYMLDGSIYAPKYYKKKLIQQVDVLLQSFRTEDELSEDRKEELLDAIED
ncbi:MAG: DUF4837 family protein [Melioribacteraceae bacterium]|nr:DUF4837 family protein [Melioribacteraceae bacterium]MCF8265535.1 DUF4837 family protein [Melioribacteraceae bacterium]MCF8432748.1 DUF4837 family protein [Melioribacteraceae bacterium]